MYFPKIKNPDLHRDFFYDAEAAIAKTAPISISM